MASLNFRAGVKIGGGKCVSPNFNNFFDIFNHYPVALMSAAKNIIK